jgi:hypothetical protein
MASRRISLVFVVFLGSAVLFSVAACATRTIYNVTDHPVPAAARTLPLHQIDQAITDAAVSYHWRVEDTGPGQIKATYERDSHQAVIAINYSQSAYSIVLVSSADLRQEDGRIDRHYNHWIRKLEKSIDERLKAAPQALK